MPPPSTAAVGDLPIPSLVLDGDVTLRCDDIRLAAPNTVDVPALAVLGAFLLVTHGSLTSLAISPPALFWGLLCAFAAAFYTVQPKRLICKYRPTLIVGWGMLVGGLLFLPISKPWAFTGIWNTAAALNFAYIILFGTVIAFVCYLGSLQYIQPAETSILGSAEPLSSILLSIALLHITFTPADLLGAISILAAVILLTRK